MLRNFFRSKIHRATTTGTNLEYPGSLTIDPDLLEAADILPYEQIQVLNIENGARFITYAIEGERGSGIIEVNGAAAHQCKKGDLLIIITYCQLTESEIPSLKPKVVLVDENNKLINN